MCWPIKQVFDSALAIVWMGGGGLFTAASCWLLILPLMQSDKVPFRRGLLWSCIAVIWLLSTMGVAISHDQFILHDPIGYAHDWWCILQTLP